MRGFPAPKSNETATTDPGAANDISQQYEALSLWRNTVTGQVWICTSNARTAAVWEPITPTGSTLFSQVFGAHADTRQVYWADTQNVLTNAVFGPRHVERITDGGNIKTTSLRLY